MRTRSTTSGTRGGSIRFGCRVSGSSWRQARAARATNDAFASCSAKRNRGIDAARSHGRHANGNTRHRRKQDRHGYEYGGIARRDTVERRREHVRERIGCRESRGSPDEHRKQAAANDPAPDRTAFRPESHAHAELVPPLLYRVGDDSVYTDRREKKRARAEISAVGNRLKVTLNGRDMIDVEDSKLSAGPIALQHGSGTVRFRNIR